MTEPIFISEETVKRLLNWEATFRAVEVALRSVYEKNVVQSARSSTRCAKSESESESESWLLTMPGYLNNDTFGALGCKLVTVTPTNVNLEQPLPSINAHIMLFDEVTGVLKAVISATEITKWRTAAASVVATKHLKPSEFSILAILGAGNQGEIHAVAFNHFFDFKEIRIWNHNPPKADKLVAHLNRTYDCQKFKSYQSNEECVRGADVIITATFAPEPIVQLEWLKRGVHINSVGAVVGRPELSDSIYLASKVYIDHRTGAETELAFLGKLGVEFEGEIGGVIAGDLKAPSLDQITVFQSLGMAVEDCAMARLVYDLHKTSQSDGP